MQNKYIYISVGVLIVALLFASYIIGYKFSTNNNRASIDTVSVLEIREIKSLPEIITDTLIKFKKTTIRDSIYIPNPLDSSYVKEYIIMTDSLKKLNVDYSLKLDTISLRNDTLNIDCNKIKNSLTMQIKYAIRYDTTKTKTVTIYDNSWHWKETSIGLASGLIISLLIGLIK